jgi:hypothetical protein
VDEILLTVEPDRERQGVEFALIFRLVCQRYEAACPSVSRNLPLKDFIT